MTTINFETETCCVCGIIFQVPEEFSDDRQTDGATYFCPNGHAQNYVDTPDERIASLEEANAKLTIEVRQLKCALLGRVGFWQRVKMWFGGGRSIFWNHES